MSDQATPAGAPASDTGALPANPMETPAHLTSEVGEASGAAASAEPDASVAAPAAPQPAHGGLLLRQAREAAGLHVAALAVALKVPVRQIEALEQGQFDRLPDPIFTRALASSVCRQLRVDPKPILAALPQAAARAPRVGEGINEPFHRPGMPGGPAVSQLVLRPPVLVAVGLLLAALLLLLLPSWFQGESSDTASPVASAPLPEMPASAPAGVASEALPPASAAAVGPGGQGGMSGLVVEPVQPALPLTGGAPAGRAP